jgi:hypothetical protein
MGPKEGLGISLPHAQLLSLPADHRRSKEFNAVLKHYVKPTKSLFEFVQQYMLIQDKILNAELKAMTDTALTEPAWWCGNAMERQMAKAYTRNIFNRF